MGSQQSTKDTRPIEQKICQKEACNIQDCLAQNNYNYERCKDVIDFYKQCCERNKEKNKLNDTKKL